MTVYKAPIVGDGVTTETAFRPDVPTGVEWGAVHIDAAAYAECLIASDADLGGVAGVDVIDTEAKLAAYTSQLPSDVARWVADAARAKWGTP